MTDEKDETKEEFKVQEPQTVLLEDYQSVEAERDHLKKQLVDVEKKLSALRDIFPQMDIEAVKEDITEEVYYRVIEQLRSAL